MAAKSKIDKQETDKKKTGRTRNKLTEEQVTEIRQRLAEGEQQIPIAARYGVRKSTISMIKSGRIRKQVPKE